MKWNRLAIALLALPAVLLFAAPAQAHDGPRLGVRVAAPRITLEFGARPGYHHVHRPGCGCFRPAYHWHRDPCGRAYRHYDNRCRLGGYGRPW
ncbi:MAG TPA: hypothetical protein VGC54_03645 [Planctomycetota bacterium]